MERDRSPFVDAPARPNNAVIPLRTRRMVDRQAPSAASSEDGPSRRGRGGVVVGCVGDIVSFIKPVTKSSTRLELFAAHGKSRRRFQDDGIKPAVETVPLAQHQ
jgi:hypothetical protein